MLKIAIKYCGGCNPNYDRVNAVESVKKELNNKVEFADSLEEYYDIVLVVQGCKNACADTVPYLEKETYQITCPEDSKAFVKKMNTKTTERA